MEKGFLTSLVCSLCFVCNISNFICREIGKQIYLCVPLKDLLRHPLIQRPLMWVSPIILACLQLCSFLPGKCPQEVSCGTLPNPTQEGFPDNWNQEPIPFFSACLCKTVQAPCQDLSHLLQIVSMHILKASRINLLKIKCV